MSLSHPYPLVNASTDGFSTTPNDSTYQGFVKYNNHEHPRCVAPDFRSTGISIGDPVYIYDEDGNDIFPGVSPPTVDYITGEKIRLTISSNVTLDGTVLYFKAPKLDPAARIIFGISTEQSSQLITFSTPLQPQDFQQLEGSGLPGFLSQKDWRTILTNDYHFNLQYSTWPTIVYLIPRLSRSLWLSELTYHSQGAGSSKSFTIYTYDPDNIDHDILDALTWDTYSESLAIDNNGSSIFSINPYAESGEWTTYPITRATNSLKVGSAIALVFSSQLDNSCFLSISLETITSLL